MLGTLLVALMAMTGCGQKDETVDKTPPPGPSAKADPMNPGKKTLPAAKAPNSATTPTVAP